MEAVLFEEMRVRIVKAFLDILILSESRNKPIGGYDVIAFIHKKFHILLSSGTVYFTLYSMERDGLIQAHFVRRNRVYTLTDKGKETVQAYLNINKKIQTFFLTFLAIRVNDCP